jgi:hypothetical protein
MFRRQMSAQCLSPSVKLFLEPVFGETMDTSIYSGQFGSWLVTSDINHIDFCTVLIFVCM